MISQWEKDLLPLSLITPVDWAERIKLRNEALLDALEQGNDDYTGEFGCPHCLEVSNLQTSCYKCRWAVVGDGSECGSGVFDGLSMGEVPDVYYDCGFETINPERHPDKSRRFLKAHVLWAERIIDGTYANYAEHHGIKTPVKGDDGIWREE